MIAGPDLAPDPTPERSADAYADLPDWCPGWCESRRAGHEQAVDEGCPAEEVYHHSAELVGQLHDLHSHYRDGSPLWRPGGESWSVMLRAPQHQVPVVALEVQEAGACDTRSKVTLNLTSGEARTLASQLTYLANQDDLHRWDLR